METDVEIRSKGLVEIIIRDIQIRPKGLLDPKIRFEWIIFGTIQGHSIDVLSTQKCLYFDS